ncbi:MULTISPECIES: EAL domain-containing protein [unclassified Legionella]|uniref:EAL domain-containing protein n=1 Tax=unclassified Legionella TaxID=2622702 RepID=UPI00105521D0|nr:MULTISPECIES: EAL domain-containing protein [unclassified Legionella]MDI9818806.1 EAL domain-containing protein [Legionella sp. PL877]
MKNTANNAATAQQILNIIWMLLTVLFLIIAMYYQWQHYRTQKQQQIQLAVDKVKVRVDDLIEGILHSVYSLPLYGREFKSCQHELLPQLKNITFNNPFISGIVIADENNTIICSTLDQKNRLPSLASKTPALLGPFKIDNVGENAFLLQQKLGQYYLGIYIIHEVIESLLESDIPAINFLGFYNTEQGEFVLKTGTNPLLDSPSYSSPQIAQSQLQNLNHFVIMAATDPGQYKQGLLYPLLMIALFVMLVSFLIYFQLRNLLNKRFSLNYALNSAIKNKNFHPAYQPIMNISENNYCGAEVLLRWQTDNYEIMPDVFIDEAEQSRLIIPITLQIIKKAFQECQDLLKNRPDFHLAFNMSASHFRDTHFFLEFYKLCKDYKILPSQIMIELTERELLDQNETQLVTRMHDLREQGYSLAVDDFGTGHASITYLQHFPFNYLKIDKIFVHAIGTGAITESLNKAIIQMASFLNLEVIAEGIETKEQLSFLQQYQVKFMQGWYFGRAVPYKQLIRIINGVGNE